MKRLLSTLLLATVTTAAFAQSDRTVVLVTDVQGNAIPFAFVQIENGVGRVADDSGRAVFNIGSKDSLRIQARRIGFEPYIGWVTRVAGAEYLVADLMPLPRSLGAVEITARRDTPLARTGFYDRVERVQRGAFAARMITPEELEIRNPRTLTQLLSGERHLRVEPLQGKQVLMGRGGRCAMTILLDGRRLLGTLEEAVNDPSSRIPISSLSGIDDLVTANSIAAIEIYGSMAAAPVELQRQAGMGGCGLVAIWTGSRR